jgi:hypothetical protein
MLNIMSNLYLWILNGTLIVAVYYIGIGIIELIRSYID